MQHGKHTQTWFKSEERNFYHFYGSLWRILSLEKVLLVICKILRLFVNSLFTADDKYSLLNGDNLTQPIQIQLSQNQKTFSWFFSAFLKSRLNFKDFQTKMTLIANVFLKLRSPKDAVRYTSKNTVSESPSTSNMANALKHCSNLRGGRFTIFIDHCKGYWVCKSHY